MRDLYNIFEIYLQSYDPVICSDTRYVCGNRDVTSLDILVRFIYRFPEWQLLLAGVVFSIFYMKF